MIAILCGLLLTMPVAAAEWPQWRGPQSDGVWRETGIVSTLPDTLTPRWKALIASGYTSPTVADGRVYVMDRLTKPEQVERVHCFDAQTGKLIWSHQYRREYRDVGYTAGPRASVIIRGGLAYALGTMGDLHVYDTASGDITWQRDLNAEYEIYMPIWGIAASPLIYEYLVIVHIGGEDACLVAFDRKSGEERWRSLTDQASYATPVLVEQADQPVLVVLTGDNVVGLEPASDAVYWRHPFPPKQMVISIATPVVANNRLFVTSFFDGALVLRLLSDSLAVE